MFNAFRKLKYFAGKVVLIDKKGASKPDAQNSAGPLAAANMADRIGSLQKVASQHGFDFLFYMLDMARAEAVSLRHGDSQSDSSDSEEPTASD